jgi:hypothetical protein
MRVVPTPLFWSVLSLLVCATLGCSKPDSYRLVSEKYGFSVQFPEKPVGQTSTNDEGLPQSSWQVNNEKIVAKDYYTAHATSYKEILDPDNELVPNEPLLALNGVKMLEHRRFKLRAPATAREVDAMAITSKELSTGATISSIYVVDGHNMISVSVRTNDDPGKAALYLGSFTLLR